MCYKSLILWWARLDSNQGPDRYEKRSPYRIKRKQAQREHFTAGFGEGVAVWFWFAR